MDLAQFARDHNLAHLLASLTIDIPAVGLASAIGALASSVIAGAFPVVAAFALGPALIAVVAGVAVGGIIWWLDQHYHINERLTAAYQRGLDHLQKVETAGEQSLGKMLFGGIYNEMQQSIDHAVQRMTGSAY